jgi:hypothetical protein
VTEVIASSMSAVDRKASEDIRRVLGGSDKEAQKPGPQMSETAIPGQGEIWRRNTRQTKAGTSVELNVIIAEEATQPERPEIEAELAIAAENQDR